MIFIQICQIIAVCLLSAVLFAILIYISMYSQKRTMPLKIAFIIMFVGGMCIYSYCHYRVIEHYRGLDEESVSGASYDRSLEWARKGNFPMLRTSYVVMRSVIDVGMMFYGRANSDIFYKLPESENPYFVFGFWLLHLITFYTMATALLIRFGNGLLRWIRINISKIFNADVDIVFGINQDSLAFGRKIADKKGNMLVYVDTVVNEEYEALIRDIGGLTYSNKDAIDASTSFLKDICIKPAKTRFRLYVLSGEYDRNLHYAQMMLESLKKADIRPEQTELVLLGTDEWKGMFFQSNETQYGYGSVVSFDEFEMTARLLIHKYPLCNAIKFDENGRATEDMDVLIIGFGHIGHEVLRKVIAAGQFVGSNFRATVYDPKFEQRTGFFKSQYPKMFKNYNVVFKPYDGRGNQIFQFLQDNASTLKYIMICLEDRDVSREIAVRMLDRLHTMGYPLNVYTCD
ncbi:MAG: hypothetical protein IJQ08_06490, partial [Synergistaceae bacterium]|nr:hypothetical protein [Synergistaceae bacterium]